MGEREKKKKRKRKRMSDIRSFFVAPGIESTSCNLDWEENGNESQTKPAKIRWERLHGKLNDEITKIKCTFCAIQRFQFRLENVGVSFFLFLPPS